MLVQFLYMKVATHVTAYRLDHDRYIYDDPMVNYAYKTQSSVNKRDQLELYEQI